MADLLSNMSIFAQYSAKQHPNTIPVTIIFKITLYLSASLPYNKKNTPGFEKTEKGRDLNMQRKEFFNTKALIYIYIQHTQT